MNFKDILSITGIILCGIVLISSVLYFNNKQVKQNALIFTIPLEVILKKGDVVYTQCNGGNEMKVFINVENKFQIYEGLKIGDYYYFKIDPLNKENDETSIDN